MTDRGKDRHRQTPARKLYLERYQYADWLWRKYGLSVEKFDAILKAQDYTCPLCKRPFEPRRKGSGQGKRTPVVDHDHTTDAVRGIICNGCNYGLGCFDDSLETLERAVFYLRTTAVTPVVNGSVRLRTRPAAKVEDGDTLLFELIQGIQ